MSDILNRFMDNTSEETAVDASKKVKVGIIGTGWIAEAHIRSYLRQPDVEIVAGADLVPGKAAPDTLPEGYKNSTEYGMDLAMKRVAEHKGIGEFFKSGAKNACSMWFGVLPSVMAIGTVALILANYTPIFEWLGIPFRPLLQLLQVPEANAVASTMIVGFTDMLTPAILIAECASDMARFIVAVVSVTQVLYLSEVGGLILGSKLPLNIWELFVIFLERTIISLLIVCPIAHLLF